jgi:predicted N-acetyltransferase YhbS
MGAEIAYLADHPELIPELAAWLHEEWGYLDPKSSVKHKEVMLRVRLNRDKIPLTLVAFLSSEPVGTASLQLRELPTYRQYLHWLGTVYVLPPYRSQGIGIQLVERAVAEAARLGVSELYLYTPDQEQMYASLGWTAIERTRHRNQDVVIMVRELGG